MSGVVVDLGRLLIAGAVLAGCATSPPAPEILRVSPDWAFNGDVTNVEIAGRNLYPNVRISASGARDEATPEGYGIRLLPTSGGDPLVLDGARLVEVDALQVVVPPDEPVGVYDLELTTPFGGVAVLTEGFRVVDTRADAFSVELDSVQWQVGEQVSFDVGVVDRAGEPIVDGRLVEIVLESRTGRPVEATFDPVGLDGWSELGDAVGVVGGLGADGVASVRLTVTRPDRLRIRARSVADDPDALRDEAVNVEVTSGEVDAIRVTVDPGLTVVAGQPVQARVEFVDAGGNVVPDASLTVALSTSCGEVGPVVADVDEAVTMIITPTRATGTFVCPEMRLIANGGGGIVGQSDPIVVQAGAVVDLDVSVASGALRAGENVPVVVFGQDAYGNLARWRDVVAAARDPGGDVFGFSCTASVPSLCTVVTTRASPSTWLEFEDAAGVVGRSQPFALAPASAAKVRFDLPIQWTAGEVEPVTLTLLDPWDNHVAPAAVLPESAVFQVSVGSVSCTPSLVQPADALAYSCVAFVATPQAELGVSLPGLAITGQSPSFRVDNGPLGSLGVSIGASLVEAGQPLVVNVSAVDAYGNPLIVQADPRLVIVDPDGILSPDEVRLDASGQSQFALRRRRSGRGVTFQITGEGGVRATSPPFDVVAGPPVSLSVTPAAPWVTVGDPLSVVVQVYDELGNRSETSGVVTLESRGNPRDVATCFLVNGTCDAVFTWTQPSAGDRIDVEVLVGGAVGTATGSSDEVLVLAECGDSPRVALSFGGRAEGIACAAPAGPTTIRGALAVTPAVGRSVLRYGLWLEDGSWTVSGSGAALDVVAPRAGVYRARAVAVQDDGCGREVESTVWIGADDGTPVGPIPMSAEAAVIDLASPTPSTRVFIDGASTCRGTSAGNVDVFVRADRGALFGVLAGASGPLVTLDAAGSASFLLDATGVPSGGRGTVYADVSSGAAQGSVAVELAGDRAPPYVWYQSPKGYVDGPVSSVVIGFSEPLDAGSVVIDAFEVRVGGALEPPGALSWSGARSEVRIDLAQPITPITQAISVSIKDGYLMDRSGNALACNLGRDNRCYFGVISGTPAPMNPVSSCEVSAAAFRPDGVDGLGVEADRVRLTWPGAGNPAWWVIDVISDAGLRVQREYLLPTTAPESWSWDGRDATGKVVEPGTWTLRVAAEDSQGSQSAACERQVDLVQRGPL